MDYNKYLEVVSGEMMATELEKRDRVLVMMKVGIANGVNGLFGRLENPTLDQLLKYNKIAASLFERLEESSQKYIRENLEVK